MVLSLAGDVKATAQPKQDLPTFIHLCGAGPATAYARRRFQMVATERCGDHLVGLGREGQRDEAAVSAEFSTLTWSSRRSTSCSRRWFDL
ncbi:hypothetical protein [Bradyrhizobium sp. CCBAU 51627]|uniref:hypothetical protein n=1 Tax=Bradyrhizobium sp. CCBAU 51627 TaxID=1325088 RepID=UPI0023054EA0|nr:hypothetical protein [Bradyrhizobium sp. CCBAU 51627]